MREPTRITLALQRQLVIGVAYIYGTLWIGVLCFNINIDLADLRENYEEMNLFRFENNWKK